MQRHEAFRVWSYAGVTLLLMAAYVLLEIFTWPYGSTQLHTIMEVTATLLATFVGVTALVRYYARRHNMILFLGVGFCGTALLDGYHAIVTSTFFRELFPSPPESLIPWSWNASRTFLSMLMFLSWLAWRREKKLGASGQVSDVVVGVGLAVLTLISFVYFAFVPLGPAYFSEFVFGRPEEFVSAAFFAAAMLGYLVKQEWRQSPLDHWIVMSLLVGFLCQALFMSRSYALFDGMFDMAHLLKIVSYVFVLVGLLHEMHLTWRIEQRFAADLEARHRGLVDTLPVCVLQKDLDGRFIFANRTYGEFTGHEIEDILGKTDFDFSPQDVAEKFRADDRKVIESGRQFRDIESNTTDGKTIWVEVIKSPIYDARRKIVGTQAIFWDVTERQKAIEALEAAKQAADAANRAKSDFLANMSHEIRTPMNAILGMTELALDTPLSRVQRDYLQMVHESGESLLELINQILDYSKIEAGKMELDQTIFPLRESLGNTMKSLSFRAQEKGLELAFRVHPEVPDLLIGDAGRFRQIVVNLVGNAVKFTEEGEVVVDVDSRPLSEREVLLECSVRDTGIGIPADKRQKIFEEFEQADNSTTRSYGGTGLGLSISAKLVKLMGGDIRVESREGEGSTFHFTARFGLGDEKGGEVPRPERDVLREMPILVVDDNATNRRILEEILQSFGMQPAVVSGAREAIEALRQAGRRGEAIPVILTDLHMPEADGFTLAEWVREDEDLADGVIIMLTSGVKPGDRARCEELGIAASLIKPVKQSELFDAIAGALGHSAVMEEFAKRPGADDRAEGPPLRVLVAEDSPVNQRLAVGMLEKLGHRTVVVNNGREAVEAISAENFDLVLMDVQMPEMDGLEATRLIRERERKAGTHLPVIAMTAHAMKGDRQRCLEAGMDGYIPKPVRSTELFEALARIRSAAPPVDSGDSDREPGVEINWERALEYVGGNRQTLQEVVQIFCSVEGPQLTRDIRTAVAENHPELLHRSAHTLKGVAELFGAERLFETARTLERMGREGKLEGADAVRADLEAELERLMPALKEFASETLK